MIVNTRFDIHGKDKKDKSHQLTQVDALNHEHLYHSEFI